jgi:SAM-dependent methyltransferase
VNVVVASNSPAEWTRRAETALWSEKGQWIRFKTALHHLNLRAEDSLLDYGCGTGALSEYLPIGVRYLGVDSSPGMLVRASQEHPGRVFLSRIPQDVNFSHVVAIGTWNLARWHEADEDIQKLWRIATDMLVVFLHRDLVTPSRLVNLYPDCLLDCSYMPNDSCLVLRR